MNPVLLFGLFTASGSCPDGYGGPNPEWVDGSSLVSASRPDAVASLDRYLFPPDQGRDDPRRAGIRTDGVVVVHHGEVLYERYGGGYARDTRHLAWSVTKSFENALAGIAVQEGLLSLDASICTWLPSVPEASCAVRVRDLLEFASGWDWHETYEGSSPTTSSVLAMLYGQGHADMAAFVASLALRDPPGSTYMYSSGDAVVLSAVVGAALSPRFGQAFPFTTLFLPIGMDSAVLETDAHGTYVGSSYLFATPRDLARFGWFLLQDGCWNGQRLLPKGWVAASTVPSEPFRKKPLARDPGDVQGRMFWLNRRVPEVGQQDLPWPAVPNDAYAAEGHWGQTIAIVPSADLVVVRTADDRDDTFSEDRLLELALALVGAP
jgi:CubicO group peptidase (beta-lactamase class C family)